MELGTAATALEQDESGVTVDITKTSGGTEVKEKTKFAYVIGTDGGHSAHFPWYSLPTLMIDVFVGS